MTLLKGLSVLITVVINMMLMNKIIWIKNAKTAQKHISTLERVLYIISYI